MRWASRAAMFSRCRAMRPTRPQRGARGADERGHAAGRHDRALAPLHRRRTGERRRWRRRWPASPSSKRAGAEDEAEAIALILREAAETPGRTAALVTPDRALARRVAARLEAWGIARRGLGRPAVRARPSPARSSISSSRPRRQSFEPIALMALLKHPLCRAGAAARCDVAPARRTLELAAFRDALLRRGLDGVDAALSAPRTTCGRRASPAVRPPSGRGLAGRARPAAAPRQQRSRRWRALFAPRGQRAVHDLARSPRRSRRGARPSRPSDDDGAALAGRGRRGGRHSSLPASSTARLPAPAHAGGRLCRLLSQPCRREDVRPRARRASAHLDLGAVRGAPAADRRGRSWARSTRAPGRRPPTPGPGSTGPCAQALGLPAPEERIGDAAHDLRLAAWRAPRLPHPRRQDRRRADGAVALAVAAAGAARPASAMPRIADQPWLAWARARNALAGPAQPVRAPEPRPPWRCGRASSASRPSRRWIANPYAIFAERILGLEPLPPLGRPARRGAARPDRARRAEPLCAALSRIAARATSRAELIAIAQAGSPTTPATPRVAAFWVPRFERFAEWFAETEAARRDGVQQTLAGGRGQAIVLAGAGRPFTLTARADRIDVGDGGLVITDYKTAATSKTSPAAPRRAARRSCRWRPPSPRRAGSPACRAGTVAELRYICASGGEPPGAGAPARTATRRARASRRAMVWRRLIARFDDAATPYRALRRARFDYRYDDYAHLARVAEWSAGDGRGGVSMGFALQVEARRRARRDAAQPGRRRRPRGLGVGQRQRRHRQDARADHARAAPAARRHAARAHPRLTYTKAAAAEMSKRVFDRLAEWVTADEASLEAQARRAARPRAHV